MVTAGTGRIINILYLLDRDLLDTPVLYLSRYIIENKDGYYRALRKVTEMGPMEAWVLYMLEGGGRDSTMDARSNPWRSKI